MNRRTACSRTGLRRTVGAACLAVVLVATAAGASAARGGPDTATGGRAHAAPPATAGSTADFDGDGRPDLVIGTPGYPTDRHADAGAVQVAYGSGAKGSLSLDRARDGRGHVPGTHAADRFGAGLATGHFTGTRYTDLVVTTFRESPGPGSGLTLFRGGPRGLVTPGLFLAQTTVDPADGPAFSGFGFGVTAGDFDGDGITDLAVAAHHVTISGHQNAGAVFVLRGSTAGLRLDAVRRYDLVRSAAFGHPPVADEFFGYGLAAGDFDGDGRDDLAVEDAEQVGGHTGAGKVRLLHGGPAGLVPTAVVLDRGSGAQRNGYFGLTLAVGDVNGDGVQDLIAGSPYETVRGHANAGTVTVFPGTRGAGLRPALRRTLTQDTPGLGTASAPGRELGLTLATGRFLGSPADDVAIGVVSQPAGGRANAGAVELLPGTPGGVTVVGSRLLAEPGAGAGRFFGGGLATLRGGGGAGGAGDADELAVSSPLATAGGVRGSGSVGIFTVTGGRLEPTGERYVLGDFPGTANVRTAGMGSYLFAPPKGTPAPVADTLGG